jgi:hypothetical protein
MVAAGLTRGGEVGVGPAGDHRGGLLLRDLGLTRRARKGIVALQEQPLLFLLARSRPHPDQMPAALEALALQLEVEMALGIASRSSGGCGA